MGFLLFLSSPCGYSFNQILFLIRFYDKAMLQLEFKTSLIKIRARITANELPKVGEFLAFHAIKYGEYFHYMSSVFSAGKRLRLRYLIQSRIKTVLRPQSNISNLDSKILDLCQQQSGLKVVQTLYSRYSSVPLSVF